MKTLRSKTQTCRSRSSAEGSATTFRRARRVSTTCYSTGLLSAFWVLSAFASLFALGPSVAYSQDGANPTEVTSPEVASNEVSSFDAGSNGTGSSESTSAATSGESASNDDARRHGYLVDVALPLIGDRDEQVRQQIEAIAKSENAVSRRPIIVLRFRATPLEELAAEPDNGGMRTRGSQFERCLALARFLTSAEANRVRLIAYLPESVEGHALLPILACEEILAAPNAELGRAAIDEPNEPTIETAYRDVVERRATLPEAVVMAMLDAKQEVFELGLRDGSTRIADQDTTQQLRDEGRVINQNTIWSGGTLATFTGEQMRARRWIERTVLDSQDLPAALGLSSTLRTSRQLPREWKAVTVTLAGDLNATRINQIIRGLNEQIDENEVNLVVFDVSQIQCNFQQASRLANFIADFDPNEVYTLGVARQDLRGPVAMLPVSCREAVLLSGATLGPDSTNTTSIGDNDVAQKFLGDLANRSKRPLPLLSAVVDADTKVKEFIHQTSGRSAIFADWQIDLQTDAKQWFAKRTVAGGDAIANDLALQYRLVDSLDDNLTIALSRLGVDETPSELQTPWLDASIEMVLAQGWLPRLLLTIGFFALMAELGNPGLGAGGFLAALCFMGFFWVEGLNGNVEALEVMLFVAGLVALAIEIFVIPGFGVFGIGGLLMLFVSVVLASQTFVWPTTSAQLGEVASNLFWTACMALAGMIGLLFMHKQLERLPMFKWVSVLPEEDPEDLNYRESFTHREHLVGQEGLTTTRLNPSGKAQFGSDIVPVVGAGELIDSGVPVKVVEVRGNLVLVDRSERVL